jgi:DNA-binding phage protein
MPAVAAVVIPLRSKQPVMLDDVEDAIALCVTEIRASGMRWPEIADRAGLCRATVSNIAYGDVKSPRMNTVLRILKVLGYRIYAQRGA